MAGYIGIDELTRRVAAYGLPGQPAAIAHEQPSDSTWNQLLSRTRKHRIGGFLMAAVDVEALPLTDDQRE